MSKLWNKNESAWANKCVRKWQGLLSCLSEDAIFVKSWAYRWSPSCWGTSKKRWDWVRSQTTSMHVFHDNVFGAGMILIVGRAENCELTLCWAPACSDIVAMLHPSLAQYKCRWQNSYFLLFLQKLYVFICCYCFWLLIAAKYVSVSHIPTCQPHPSKIKKGFFVGFLLYPVFLLLIFNLPIKRHRESSGCSCIYCHCFLGHFFTKLNFCWCNCRYTCSFLAKSQMSLVKNLPKLDYAVLRMS